MKGGKRLRKGKAATAKDGLGKDAFSLDGASLTETDACTDTDDVVMLAYCPKHTSKLRTAMQDPPSALGMAIPKAQLTFIFT